jgi:hypothetical protein
MESATAMVAEERFVVGHVAVEARLVQAVDTVVDDLVLVAYRDSDTEVEQVRTLGNRMEIAAYAWGPGDVDRTLGVVELAALMGAGMAGM